MALIDKIVILLCFIAGAVCNICVLFNMFGGAMDFFTNIYNVIFFIVFLPYIWWLKNGKPTDKEAIDIINKSK